jgi:NAD(P)-dependent dehydrogenase (short-subunit alcohol dehydrogenase family)
MSNSKKFAVITGARRGLGLAAAQGLLEKGYEVVLGLRDPTQDPKLGPKAHVRSLDVSNPASIERFAREVQMDFERIDVLINNAAIFVDSQKGDDVLDSFRSNSLGPALLIHDFLPGMLARGHGRIVNVSSGMGQLSEMQAGYLAYRVSKAALNAVTKVFAAEANGKDVLINSVCPGWVRTDMGGAQAERSIEEGVSGILWAATLPKGGPSGGFYRDGKPLAW